MFDSPSGKLVVVNTGPSETTKSVPLLAALPSGFVTKILTFCPFVKPAVPVVNEIDVGNRENLKEYANDLWITTQSKALAIKTIGLRGLSYNFETIKGRVYVIGITSKQDQLDSVIKVVRTIKGVKEIVNYVIINEG